MVELKYMGELNQSNQSNITPEHQPEISLKPKFPQWGLMLIIIGLLIIGSIGYYVYHHFSADSVACTMDAKICPDGSSVGRIPPDCEFAPCPEIDTTDWQTYRNEEYGFEMKYPRESIISKAVNAQGELVAIHINDGDLCSIELIPKEKEISLKDFAVQSFEDEINKTVFIEKAEVADRESYKLRGMVDASIVGPEEGIMIFVSDDDFFYRMNCNEKKEENVNKFLSTFKFID